MTRITLGLFLSLGLLLLPAAARQQHVVDAGKVASGAVTLAAFNKRIEDSAADALKQYRPGTVDRIALFDSAFPLDEAEYKASGGYGVLLVSALSRDNSELPLTNVYIGGNKLKFIGGISREVPSGSPVEAAFGKFRTDSFWLVPAALFRPEFPITADFAKNRMGFTLGNAPGLPSFMQNLPVPGPSGSPGVAAIKKMVAREYPGFGIEISP